ncbi:MAG: hypothetical protein IPP44_25090 [Ideonella sp.]|nr:hypothetical protein [Ideonella sp.]
MSVRHLLLMLWALVSLSGCGGGSGNPLGNPQTVANPAGTTGQKLSFAYFQACVQPILIAPLPIEGGGGTNTCAAAGCHDSSNGTGGALRLAGAATRVDLADPANTPELIRLTDMYRNFYSAQGVVLIGAPAQSLLLNKPRLINVLHGGGRIFSSADDGNVKRISYWINHPMPQGQDEFSAAGNALFTPADPQTGTCNTP